MCNFFLITIFLNLKMLNKITQRVPEFVLYKVSLQNISLGTNISIAQVLLSDGCQDCTMCKIASATDRSSHNLVFCTVGLNMFSY